MQNRLVNSRVTRIRITALILGIATLALLAVGCGSSDDNKGSSGLPSEITLGASLPLTGPGAAYGTTMKNGLQLGINQINAADGVDGSKLKMVALDSQAQAGPAVSNAKQLIDANDAIAIASAFTAPPLAQLPIAERSKVPLFNGGGYDPELLGHDWLYNNILTLGQEAKAGMTYANQDLGVKKLGMITETDITADSIPKVENEWKQVSGSDPITTTIDQTATNAGPQIDKVLAGNPDAIYLATDGNISSLIYKQLSQRDINIPIISSSASLAVPEATSSPSLDLYFTRQPFKPSAEFNKAYKAKFPKEEPNIYFVNYYNMAYLVKEALEYAVENDLGTDGAGLKQAIDEKNSFTGCCGAFSFTEEHGSTDPAQVVKIQNGTPKPIKTIPTS